MISVPNSSRDEMSLSEENTSLVVQSPYGTLVHPKDSLNENESVSDREEGEDEENIQEAFNQLYDRIYGIS